MKKCTWKKYTASVLVAAMLAAQPMAVYADEASTASQAAYSDTEAKDINGVYERVSDKVAGMLANGELTYSFLKGKRGLLKFQVVDILQQRDFVNRWMNDTGQGETWTWGLGRYAMATFTYRFNDLSR